MQFKKARLDLNQIRRPFSAGKGGGGGAKEEAERRAYREAEKAQMLAKRVEQTMAKVCFLALSSLSPVCLLHAADQLMYAIWTCHNYSFSIVNHNCQQYCVFALAKAVVAVALQHTIANGS